MTVLAWLGAVLIWFGFLIAGIAIATCDDPEASFAAGIIHTAGMVFAVWAWSVLHK